LDIVIWEFKDFREVIEVKAIFFASEKKEKPLQPPHKGRLQSG